MCLRKDDARRNDTVNTKPYVDNLAGATAGSEQRELFSACGNVAEVNIVLDRTSHEPRGFGFVTMAAPEGARAAVQSLDGKMIGAHGFLVTEARPPERPVVRTANARSPRRRSSHLFESPRFVRRNTPYTHER